MSRSFLFIIIISLFTGSFIACDDNYEDYSTSPNDVLSFSTDTLSFDTIISTIGSRTKKFMIYNHNSKPLQISTIYLAGAGNSGFRLNVDGKSGSSFSNVEIRSEDSLYVFVETTLKENSTNNPIVMLDSIIFQTNTVNQKVILQAYGQDAYIWKKGAVIETDSILKNDKPYLIYDSLVVRKNTTLIIPEGITIYMHDRAKIEIYGTLKILGSREKPVTIRGERMDYLLGISYDKLPGQWNGIRFYEESYENEINYAHIRNGIHGMALDSSNLDRSKLKLYNSVLTNVYYKLFNAVHCSIEAGNCEFSNAGESLVSLNGGKYKFTQCTLANYFVWSSRKSASLQFKNYKKDGETVVPLPLSQADFFNCIVYGSNTSEISTDAADAAKNPGIDFNYHMDYCLIKMKYEDLSTTYITNYILNKDPQFKTIDRENYVYDFRLDTGSPAIDSGSSSYVTPVFSTDMNGIPRSTGENPDRGAYEWIQSESK